MPVIYAIIEHSFAQLVTYQECSGKEAAEEVSSFIIIIIILVLVLVLDLDFDLDLV